MNDNIKLLVSKKQLYHAGTVLLVIITSFISGYELGKKWGRSHQKQEVEGVSDINQYFTQDATRLETSGNSAQDQSVSQVPEKKVETVEKSADSKAGSQNFVASRNGTKFYPVGCKSADRIKTENRVYFSSEEEAVRAGLEAATTC